jgi:hypothetical protein
MPQSDLITFFPHIIIKLLVFVLLYTIYSVRLLPTLEFSFKFKNLINTLIIKKNIALMGTFLEFIQFVERMLIIYLDCIINTWDHYWVVLLTGDKLLLSSEAPAPTK